MITREKVLHIAKLSRLKLTDEEVEHYTGQLANVLSYVEQLESAPTEGIVPGDTIAPLHDALREDVPVVSLSREEILQNGPKIVQDHFAVPKVIG